MLYFQFFIKFVEKIRGKTCERNLLLLFFSIMDTCLLIIKGKKEKKKWVRNGIVTITKYKILFKTSFSKEIKNVHSSIIMHVHPADNMKKVKPLLDIPGAESKLSLWKANLAEEGSFDEAIKGCIGVFHVATPIDFESKDPEVHSSLCQFQIYKMILCWEWIIIIMWFGIAEWSDKACNKGSDRYHESLLEGKKCEKTNLHILSHNHTYY